MKNIFESILGLPAGKQISIKPDFFVINDGVSNLSVDMIRSVSDPEKVFVIYDHDVPAGRPEAANVLRKNYNFAKTYGCHYVQSKGIGYLYLLHNVLRPGQIVLGGGNHGAIYGAGGVLGIDVSAHELATAIETGEISLTIPEIVSIELVGSLPSAAGPSDAAFALLKEYREVLRGKALVINAPAFSRHEKEVFFSIVGSMGAYTAVSGSISSNLTLTFDLSSVTPMIMLPCSERSAQSFAEFCKIDDIDFPRINAGQIGGYTGGSIEDLREAAALLDGRKLSLGFRLSICPATSEDYILACNEGIITKFIDYGAQINAPGDHSEIIQGPGAMGANETVLTTGLYTYAGAMGVKSAKVFSTSVRSVALASASAEN